MQALICIHRTDSNVILFILGQVIRGWDIAVATMTKGELCDIILKPDYAYGEGGSPPRIPANATLIFEVRLFFYWVLNL